MSSRKILVIAVLVAAVVLVGLRFLEPVHPRFDSGAYVIAAKSIAEGEGLRHLAHPEQPPFTTYPPVIPSLLGPFATFAKEGFVGLKIGVALFFLLIVAVFLVGFSLFLPENQRIYGALILISGSLLAFAGRIQGEVPFAFMALMALVFAHLFLTRLTWSALVGMIVSMALLANMRQAGIAWAAGALAAMFFAPFRASKEKRELVMRIVAVVLIVAVVIIPWLFILESIQPGAVSPGKSSVLRADGWDPEKGRISLVSRAMIGRLKMNLFNSAVYAPESFFFQYNLSKHGWVRVLLVPIFLVMLIGYLWRFVRERSVAEWITAAYCGLIMITPWLEEPRFFTVILPLLILYLYEGIRGISVGAAMVHDRIVHGDFYHARKLVGEPAVTAEEIEQEQPRWAPLIFMVFCTVVFAANLAFVIADDHRNPWSAVDHPDYELAKWAKDKIPEGAVVLAHDSSAFYLNTGRHSLSFTASEQKYLPQYKLEPYLARGGRIDYIAWVAGDDELVKRFLKQHGLSTEPVAENARFRLHKIKK